VAPSTWSPVHGLDPTPAEARQWLEQELHGSDYRDPWLDSVIAWIVDHVRALSDGADDLAGLSPVITAVAALVVIALLAWVLPRVRRESAVRHRDGGVLDDLTITARIYRDRASQALRDGRYDQALLDGFRAMAKDMSDRTLLSDAPGRTAHEIGLALAPFFPDHADRLARAADMFDAVRYGHQGATADQASLVQHLDAELVTTRPMLAPSPLQDAPV
jgi:hypothetical protein